MIILPSSSRLFSRKPRVLRVAPLLRSASTQAHGLTRILQKNSDDVVITFAKRTALGKVKKGQLKDTPVDELLHALFRVLHVHCIPGETL